MREHLIGWAVFLAGCVSAPEAVNPPSQTLGAPKLRGASSALPNPASADPLDSLVEAALARHPALKAQHARWRAEEARVDAEGRWANPIVGYTFAPLPIETRLGPNRHTLTTSQRIPWVTHTKTSKGVARAGAKVMAERFDARYIAIRLEVEQLYWALWSHHEERRVLRRVLSLMETIEVGLRSRVEVGARPASELARAGLQRARLFDRVTALESVCHAHEAALGRALGLTRAHSPTFDGSIAPSSEPPSVDLEETLAGLEFAPHLRALDAEITKRRAELAAAALDRKPSFELGAQWSIIGQRDADIERNGRDAVLMRVGVSLPVWTRSTQAKLDAAEAKIVAAKADLEHERLAWLAALRDPNTGLDLLTSPVDGKATNGLVTIRRRNHV
ncbi:MAG: TolC family protein, partial [Myxococcota bacterium]